MRPIKTKKRSFVNRNFLIVTADMGKDKHFGYWRCPDGTDVSPSPSRTAARDFGSSGNVYPVLRSFITLTALSSGTSPLAPGAEPLAHFMRARGAELVQVNPFHTKRFKEATDNSPNKTDQKDPKVIADIIAMGRFLTVVIPEGRLPNFAGSARPGNEAPGAIRPWRIRYSVFWRASSRSFCR